MAITIFKICSSSNNFATLPFPTKEEAEKVLDKYKKEYNDLLEKNPNVRVKKVY